MLTAMTFSMGEEVLYDDERYVIWGISEDEPKRYRLLATTKKGAKMLWVNPKALQKMRRYTEANNDTANY
jgi:hypothetical protein